ncbi:Ger(x)C family spore germination protein [Cytobacillus oceanisediminis]|uniref:Ger(x)C family spore germination protein n=1 Tax=Cytobacillus oceanisediminis TaxID=665099 RepID=UPI003736B500
MKKAIIGILLLVFLTGCWDQLQLRDLQLVDIAGFDLDEENEGFLLHYIVTSLKGAGQGGGGEATSEMTTLKGTSLVQAIGEGQYTDKAPFLGINTRLYMMSKSFAENEPIKHLNFLLYAPYASINTPLVVFEGKISELLKMNSVSTQDFTKKLNHFITEAEKNSIMPSFTMMQFIQSEKEPLEGIAIPKLKQSPDSGIVFDGVLLFHKGQYSGEELNRDQVRMVMLMLGKDIGRQRYTGKFKKNNGKELAYGFAVKKGISRITVHPEIFGLPIVDIDIHLKIHVFELGKPGSILKPDYINRMEKELSKHLEEKSLKTIETLQKGNCDLLGIGQHLKAFHPDIWKSLDWSKDYPELPIKPNIDVQILNSNAQ